MMTPPDRRLHDKQRLGRRQRTTRLDATPSSLLLRQPSHYVPPSHNFNLTRRRLAVP